MIKRFRLLALLLPLLLSFLSSTALASERAQTAWQWVEQGAVVIDVRTPQEFAAGHLDNAINIPVSELSQTDLSFLNKGDHVVVYCRSGNRSANAEQLLLTEGYKHVHNGGGLQEMRQVEPK
ncbi:sulfurtransferase [Vibrio sp. UCD-FRSSP16_10]|uniref:rhodanese-like domain-containing protein n=1 Tax=unclassified Vibrio TaxID=2614977 RepID=UPI0007FFB6F4|nr:MULTISPECIES: rhodanese-like domain-containing protein [unclassified Vibrio]OBT13384.1 sulfurtransferase [Vibrio sp. UCD-FRSSP16_10]OBT17894.1 sulfurtransferase [Vibrio sp. UCD-FRSSP16_30]